jgi:hypothetical protein
MGGTRKAHERKCLDVDNCKNDTTRETKHRWEDNIKMDLIEVGWEGYGLDSSCSEYGFVNTEVDILVPKNAEN